MEFGHAPVIEILTAAHGIGEVYTPVIAVIHIGEGGGNSTFSHNSVSLAEERLTHYSYLYTGCGGFDGGAQAGATGTDDEHIVWISLVLGH
jgi:hypothetical protein